MAALTKKYHDRLVATNQAAELRISIGGESQEEWTNLAAWIESNELINLSNIRWMIQVHPRCFATKNGDARIAFLCTTLGSQAVQRFARLGDCEQLWW